MKSNSRPQSPALHVQQHELSSHSHPPIQPSRQQQPLPQPQSIPSKREAFEKFKVQHPDFAPSQENHAVLKEKYAVAKEYSEQVNQSREKISMLL